MAVKGYIQRIWSNYIVLNNLRNKFDPMLEKIGVGFAALGFGPNFWTWMGLILSIVSAIMFSLHSPSIGANLYISTVLGGIFLLIAGFLDAVDGAVARVTKKTSVLGGFLDSIIDKVSEIIIFIGILIGNYTNPVLVLVTLSMAILVSYTRARADSIGVDLKGKGIAERAERILILAILAFIPFKDNISVALWIISILSIVTIVERLRVVSDIFGVPLLSVQTLSQIFKREDIADTKYSSSSNTSRSSYSNNLPPSTQSFKTSSSSEQKESMPATGSTDFKKESKSDTKPSTSPKANFIDKSDPNEMGRNVAQLIFEQENEDKKLGRESISSAPSSSSTTKSKKPDSSTTNTSSSSSSSTPSSSASSTSKTNTTTSSDSTKEDNNSNK